MAILARHTGSCSDGPVLGSHPQRTGFHIPRVLADACFLSSSLFIINTSHLQGCEVGSHYTSDVHVPEDEGCGASLPGSVGNCPSSSEKDSAPLPFVNCLLMRSSCAVFHLLWTFGPFQTCDQQAHPPQLPGPPHAVHCVLDAQDFSSRCRPVPLVSSLRNRPQIQHHENFP